MLPLLGSFKKSIGNFANPGAVQPMIGFSKGGYGPELFVEPTPRPTGTIFPIITPTVTPTPLPPTGADQIFQFPQLTLMATMAKPAQATLPTITYDLDRDVYERSDALRLKYADKPVIETYQGKYSYYWPPLGGANCDTQNGVLECEYMANGYKVADFVGIGWACDAKIPLGYIIEVVELNIWGECTDRGYTIKQDHDGLYWFDQLIGYPLTSWEAPITVRTYAP